MTFCRAGAVLLAVGSVFLAPLSGQVTVVDTGSVLVGLEPPAEFVLVSDGALRSDGSFLVLDRWGHVLYAFDADGRLASTIGGRGQGPGEFADPFALVQADDTTWVLDSTNGRATGFSRMGERLAELSMRTPFVPGEVERLEDGRWIMRRQPLYRQTIGLQRDTVDYFILTPSMRSPRRLTRIPGALGGAYRVSSGGIRHGVAAFSPKALADVFGPCVYLTSTDRPEIVVLQADGTPVGRYAFSAPTDSREVTDHEKRRFVQFQVANPPPVPGYVPPDEATQRAMLEVDRFGETLPFTDGLIVDPYGYVWLQNYGIGGRAQSATVLTPSLTSSVSVVLPDSVKVLDVGRDHLLGLDRGPFGEHVVRRYHLDRQEIEGSPPAACPSS